MKKYKIDMDNLKKFIIRDKPRRKKDGKDITDVF